MKKIFKIIILFIIILPIGVSAYCTTDDKIRYSNLAVNIATSYEYEESNGSVVFSVTLHNVHKDLTVRDITSGSDYRSTINELNDFVINDLKDGNTYSFEVYTNNSDCSYRLLNTLYVTLPKYNQLYSDPVCDGASGYSLCQKWADIGNISYNEFVKLVNDYKNQEVIENVETKEEKTSFLYILGNFWAKYYIYINVSIIAICVPIIIIKYRKDRFDF